MPKDIRPLSKLAAVSEIRHQAGAENRSVHVVHEDSSTALMPNFATSVEFQNRSIDLSNDDKNLFRQTMRDVKPLPGNSKNIYKKPPPTITIKKNINRPLSKHIHIENKHEVVDSEEIIFFSGNGISKKQLLNLKNARERYSAKLDLHGLLPIDAEDILSRFISNQYKSNTKIVLVIHGKSGRDSSPPVIKNLVNSYLRQMPEVLAFYSAQPKDGGTGAVYVLLKSSNFNL